MTICLSKVLGYHESPLSVHLGTDSVKSLELKQLTLWSLYLIILFIISHRFSVRLSANTHTYKLHHFLLFTLFSEDLVPYGWENSAWNFFSSPIRIEMLHHRMHVIKLDLFLVLICIKLTLLWMCATHALEHLLKTWWNTWPYCSFSMSVTTALFYFFLHHWTPESAFVFVMKGLCGAALL